MINKEGLTKLLENYTYAILEVNGRKTMFEEYCSILEESDVIVEDKQLLQDTYDFICDLYDDNAAISPVTTGVLNIVKESTTQHFDDLNSTPVEIEKAVRDFLVTGDMNERTIDSIAMAARSMATDLQCGISRYK